MKKEFNYFVLGLAMLVIVNISCVKKSQHSKVFLQDKVKLLNPNENKSLDSLLNNYKKTSGCEIFVYITDKIPDGITGSEYAGDLVNNLGAGIRGVNNGAVIFLSVKDRDVELRLAHGFEWNIDNRQADSIVKGMMNFFSYVEFYKGLYNGINRVINLTKSSNWSLCKAAHTNSCISKIMVKRIIDRQQGHIIVETTDLERLRLNYTDYMMDLIDAIEKDKGYTVYCRFISSNEANLLGVDK